MATMIATAIHAIQMSRIVRCPISFCNGDGAGSTALSMPAILPISVRDPVSVTINVAVPRVTEVFWKRTEDRSPSAASGSVSGSLSLATGALSPVNALSATSREALVAMRPSAGTRSPASTITMSPGTSASAEISMTDPCRRTRADGVCNEDRAATLSRALSSCRAPMLTLRVTRKATSTAVSVWPIRKDTAATTVSMMFIGVSHCLAAICQAVGRGATGRTLGPNSAVRRVTSSSVSPVVRSVRRV